MYWLCCTVTGLKKSSILCMRSHKMKSTDGEYYDKRPKFGSWSRNIYLIFFSELHQYQTGQCYLMNILSGFTGSFGSSSYSRLQGNSITLTNYILRSWRRLDNDDAMNDRPEHQMLNQHNDSDLKMEEQQTRTMYFKYISDIIRRKRDDFITKPFDNKTSVL